MACEQSILCSKIRGTNAENPIAIDELGAAKQRDARRSSIAIAFVPPVLEQMRDCTQSTTEIKVVDQHLYVVIFIIIYILRFTH